MTPQRSAPVRTALAVLTLALGATGFAGSAPAAEIVTVDLLVLYTPAADARYGGNAEARIQHVVAVANQIYEDSQVPLRLRLVHSEEVSYSETRSSSRALDDLTRGHSLHDRAARLRDRYGADFVTLMRPYVGDGVCGIAWLGGYNRPGVFTQWDAAYAYSHVSINCSDSVLTHELGHNMGLSHSRRQNPGGGTFPHSVGHGVDGLFVTVMAYESAFGARRVHKVSNPALSCSGEPCGVDQGNRDLGADAAHSLQYARRQLAGYRPTVAPAAPSPEVSLADPARLLAGETVDLSWTSQGVSTVDLAVRTARMKKGRRRGVSAWSTVASDLAGSGHTWTVPLLTNARPVLQLRATGYDENGLEVASHATGWLAVHEGEIVVADLGPLVGGQNADIDWTSRGVTSVDIEYRTSRIRKGSRKVSRRWSTIVEDFDGASCPWDVPDVRGRKPKAKVRITGRNANGDVVAVTTTGWMNLR
ncbi:MAG: hypothetical protein HKP30_01795 [Myxococcales bacterium]|nr:hypothetical protein [Myxococcales bacterium]